VFRSASRPNLVAEPLLHRSATVELDGRRPVEELADIVETLLAATS
jgi:hypothetical protein